MNLKMNTEDKELRAKYGDKQMEKEYAKLERRYKREAERRTAYNASQSTSTGKHSGLLSFFK